MHNIYVYSYKEDALCHMSNVIYGFLTVFIKFVPWVHVKTKRPFKQLIFTLYLKSICNSTQVLNPFEYQYYT